MSSELGEVQCTISASRRATCLIKAPDEQVLLKTENRNSSGDHKAHALWNSTKVLDRKEIVGLISYEKSTPVVLPQYRSKIKISLHVGMKEVPYR